jgi:hypothetical protein
VPRATWVQHNFNGGEWSPLAHGRADLAKYKNGLATCINYIPTSQGGLTRRPGFAYVANVKTAGAAVKLVPFEFSITQAYVLEFGNLYVRFYTNSGQLESSPGVAYEVVTPYTTADLADLAFTQSADTLYLAHPNYAPRKLVRAGALSWALSAISFQDGPYLPTNISDTTLTPSGTTGSITVTASAVTGINGGSGFVAADVGRSIRIKSGSTWGWGTITAVGSTTSITVSVTTAMGGTSATSLWRLGVWNSANGYPRAVAFHQDRLFWAGAAQYPNRIDGSNTSDYENFTPSDTSGTVVDSNAISFSLNASKVNTINWMLSDEWGLLAGTASAEWVMAPSTTQNALTPTNVTAKTVTSYGSTNIPPQRMGKSTLFVQRAKRKLREMTYQFTLGTFSAPDISLVSEHLTKGGLKQMAAAMQPYPILWMCRLDGTLVGVSYDKDQEVSAWHQHELGGYSDAGQSEPPVVESVCVIPSEDVDRDELWVAVQRYVNGGVVRTVERLTKYWEDGDDIEDAFFVDSGATYDGVATTTISGLTWLKGQTVKVLANGATHPDCVVNSSGVITLSRSVTKASVGLHSSSRARTLRIEAAGADGPAQGKLKRLHRAVFRFFQSIGLSVAGSGTPTAKAPYPIPFRTSADLMDNPVGLFTGDKEQRWEGTYDRDGQVYWEQPDPLPSNVTMLAVQLDTQDG